MNLVLAYFAHLVAKQEKNLVSRDVIVQFKRSRNIGLIIASIFVISALPFFWTAVFFGVEWRFLIWILTIPAIRIAHSLGEA